MLQMSRKCCNFVVGKKFNDLKLKRSDEALTISIVNSCVKVNDNVVQIDPLRLFHRIAIVKKSDEQLKTYMEYELPPHPLSSFNTNGITVCSRQSRHWQLKKWILNTHFTKKKLVSKKQSGCDDKWIDLMQTLYLIKKRRCLLAKRSFCLTTKTNLHFYWCYRKHLKRK